jgi:exosortase/archaeosortase family protein
MKTQNKSENLDILWLIFRYFCLFILALLLYFSKILYPFLLNFTIYPANWLINLFHTSIVISDRIIVSDLIIEIIPACVAVSAYFLFLILNLSTPMTKKQRIYSLLFLFLSFLVINILRIFIFSLLFINNYVYFDVLHKSSWYFINVLIVVGLWFLTTHLFKIRNIPIYTDFERLIKNLNLRKS